MRKRVFFIVAAVAFFAIVVTASASHAPTNLTIVRYSAKTVTVGWSPVAGATGYGLYRDGVRVSTAGAGATSAKFGTPEYRQYVLGVEALKTGGAMSTITVEPRWVTISVNIPNEEEPPPPAPNVTITSQPANPTTATSATFTWSATNASSFMCLLDGGPEASCTSPRSYTGLAIGTHTFRVTASGLGGTAQASASWTIEAVTPPPPPPGGTANLWVDANGGTCVRQITATNYADADACGSFAAAYTAAVSGDTIGVTGSLGNQFFAGDWQGNQPAGSKMLTFRGMSGNKVRQVVFGSPNLTFDGINVDAGGTKTTGAAFENGGDAFVFKNGSIGNVVDEKGALVTGAGIVFDSVRFHDVTLVTDGVHNECVWAAVPEGMIIRNSTFTNCRTFDLFTTYPGWWSPLPPAFGGVVLESNTFNSPVPAGHPTLYVADTGPNGDRVMRNWTVRNNHFATSPTTAPQQGGTYCGNTGSAPSGWTAAC